VEQLVNPTLINTASTQFIILFMASCLGLFTAWGYICKVYGGMQLYSDKWDDDAIVGLVLVMGG
jgi:hypothetical protein